MQTIACDEDCRRAPLMWWTPGEEISKTFFFFLKRVTSLFFCQLGICNSFFFVSFFHEALASNLPQDRKQITT